MKITGTAFPDYLITDIAHARAFYKGAVKLRPSNMFGKGDISGSNHLLLPFRVCRRTNGDLQMTVWQSLLKVVILKPRLTV